MAEVITMPKISEKITSGTITKWFVRVGDAIKQGQILAEVEIDKATMELESYEDGILLYQAEENTVIPIDGLMGIIGTADEDITSLLAEYTSVAPPKIEDKKTETPANTPRHKVSPLASAEYITMPFVHLDITQATLTNWLVNIGDHVKKGDLIAEVDTDKVNLELDTHTEGTVLYFAISEGNTLKENDLMAIIGDANTDLNKMLSGFGDAPLVEQSTIPDYYLLTLPSVGKDIKTARIINLHVNVGDTVEEGTVVASMETKKVEFEMESYESGTVLYLAPSQKDIPIDGLIAIIGKPSTNISAVVDHYNKMEIEKEASATKGGFLSFLKDLLPPYK